MPTRKRNIACLESLWDEKTENRLNVIPIMDIMSKLWDIKYSHLTCNTKEELEYNLNLLCKRDYGILYMAFHGVPGAIYLHNETNVTLVELSEIMSHKFSGWIVHFSSCSTLKKQKELAAFVNQTGVALVSGFTRQVDWAESAALELLLFQELQHQNNLKIAWRNVQNHYPDLVRHTGLQIYPET